MSKGVNVKDNKPTSNKGRVRSIERKISEINSKIHFKENALKSLLQSGPRIKTVQVPISEVSKEVLAEKILAGVILYGNSYGDVYFEEEQVESAEEFTSNVKDLQRVIDNLVTNREYFRTELSNLKEFIAKENEKYKNPEYIEFLKLKKKFENEEKV